MLEEIIAHDTVALGEPDQAALEADQALVDLIELLDQRVDARGSAGATLPRRLFRF